MPRHVFESHLGVVDNVDATQEGLHRQAAGMPRKSRGRQHMVGPRAVVTEAHRRPRPNEDGASRTYPAGDLWRVCGLDLEVLSRIGIHHLDAGIEIVDQDDRRLATPQRGCHSLVMHRRRQLSSQFGIGGIGEVLTRGNQHTGSHLIVLGLTDQIRGNVCGVGCVVGQDRDFGRPRFGVNATCERHSRFAAVT